MLTFQHASTFIISLDFELHWGVRDTCFPFGAYHANLVGARRAIPELLKLFAAYDIAATWATVGFLFAASREELQAYSPIERPNYVDTRLSPYQEPIGKHEADDPLHFAPSLISAIACHPKQEVATHTFSHFYCLEPGQHKAAFTADIASAVALAQHHGYKLQSIVFPRNQCNPMYADVLLRYGITSYRGSEQAWMYQASTTQAAHRKHIFATRWLDRYVNISGFNGVDWNDIVQDNGLCNIAASRFLRPYTPRWHALEPLFLKRVADSMYAAATSNKIFHLWWHPHNFGKYLEENIARLTKILDIFQVCKQRYGMQSLTMSEAAYVAQSMQSLSLA